MHPGCPSNAGKSTMNTYIADALARGSSSSAPTRPRRGRRGRREASSSPRRASADGARLGRSSWQPARSTRRSSSSGPASRIRDRPARPPPCAPRLRALRRAAGRAHGLPDPRALPEAPARRGRLRDRASTIQDPIAFATTAATRTGRFWGQRLVDAVRQFRTGTGSSRWRTTTTTRPSRSARTAASGSRSTHSRPSATSRRRPGVQPRRARGGRRDAGLLDWARVDARAGLVPDGRRPGALGGRSERRVARGQAPLRRRRSLVPARCP